MAPSPSTTAIQERVWHGRVPLQIVLAPSECRTYDKVDPYLVSYPRLSYLPFLLPRLRAFFSSHLINPDVEAHHGWFSFEGIPLKWHYPVGLLFDLYAGAEPATSRALGPEHMSHSTILRGGGGAGGMRVADDEEENDDDDGEEGDEHDGDRSSSQDESTQRPLPWRLTVHFSDWPDEDLARLDAEGKVMHDAFINSVKEADFLRNGTAKGIMTLSREDSFGLWQAVQDHDFTKFHRINNILLPNASTTRFRNIPLRIFLPSPPNAANPSLKVIQSTLPPIIPSGGTSTGATTATSTTSSEPGRPSPPQTVQTVGTAFNALLPSLFPSKRFPVLAKPVLHGAVVPMTAPLEELVRCAAYADGWLGIVVCMVRCR